MLVHTFNTCTHEAESDCFLSVQGHPGLSLFEGWGLGVEEYVGSVFFWEPEVFGRD